MAAGLIFIGVVFVALSSVRLRQRTPVLVNEPPMAATAGVAVSIRRRLGLMFGIAVIAAIVLVLYGAADPASFGLLLALAPGTATAIALLGFVAYPSPRHAARSVRSASLEPRTPGRYLSRRAITGPAAAAAGLVLFLIYAGVTSSTDDAGLFRSIAREDDLGLQVAGPFPGWYYALPLISLTVILAGLTAAAVWRIAAAPAEPDARMNTFDVYWRRRTSQLVVLLSTVTLLAYTVGVLLFAGSATQRVATAVDQSGEPVVHAGSMILGWVEIVCGLALLAVTGWLLLGIAERLRSFALATKSHT